MHPPSFHHLVHQAEWVRLYVRVLSGPPQLEARRSTRILLNGVERNRTMPFLDTCVEAQAERGGRASPLDLSNAQLSARRSVCTENAECVPCGPALLPTHTQVSELGLKPVRYISLTIKMAEMIHLSFEWEVVPTQVTLAGIKESIRTRHGGTLLDIQLYKDLVPPHSPAGPLLPHCPCAQTGDTKP